MEKYINQIVAIDTILSNSPEAHYPSWYAEQIANLPAADVVEVVHGEWKNSKAVVGTNAETMEFEIRDTDRCSICDMDFIATRPRYKYCPNCGAKMDGEKNKRGVRVRAIKRKGR